MGGVGSGRRPRQYPAEIVALARRMYLDEGMTVAEIGAVFPKGYRVQTLIQRHVAERRPSAKRNQRGSANDMWRGDEAGYQALHLRVQTARGKPNCCERCRAESGKLEWANLTGRYEDIWDYARMCVPCHRRYDAARRRANGGRSTRLRGVVPNV